MPPPAVSPPPATAGRPRRRPGSTRRDPLALLVLAGLLLVLRVGLGIQEAGQARPAAGAAPVDHVRWRTLEEGLAEARATGRPILYDFTADWCPPCRLMQREIFADPRAAADLEQGFVPVRVLDRLREESRNAAWVDSLQKRYQVTAFPTLVVAPADGREPVRIEGYLGRDFTLRRIESAARHLRLQLALPRAPAAH